MSVPETLVDELYARTFGKPVPQWKSNKLMRKALTQARRFILDDAMASFMADITAASVHKRTQMLNHKAEHVMRRSARLPHAVCWFEYDFLKYCAREKELQDGNSHYEPTDDEKGIREGWLLNNFDQSDQEFRVQLFHRIERADGSMEIQVEPFAFLWRTDAGKPNAHVAFKADEGESEGDETAHVLNGVLGGHDATRNFPQVSVASSELLTLPIGSFSVHTMFGRATGLFRRLWALLSTINDIPVLQKTVQQAKGFSAKARYHQFLEHRMVYLHVPQKVDRRRLARSVVAIAKRRAHQVRGHWREDWRHPGDKVHKHEWCDDASCVCGAHRLWIHEHQRGDASLGFVTHDYEVLH